MSIGSGKYTSECLVPGLHNVKLQPVLRDLPQIPAYHSIPFISSSILMPYLTNGMMGNLSFVIVKKTAHRMQVLHRGEGMHGDPPDYYPIITPQYLL